MVYYGVIYEIVNKKNGKIYIGQTTSQDPFKYFLRHISNALSKKPSSKPLYRAMKKYGAENFVFTVLLSCASKEDLDKAEIKEISSHNTLVPFGYNLMTGGSAGKASPALRILLSRRTKEAMQQPKIKAKLVVAWTDARRKALSNKVTGQGNPSYGKTISEETRRKLSTLHKGRERSEATKRALSEALKGRSFSEEHRNNISEAKQGKPLPISTLKAALAANTGRPLSNEHKEKISLAQRGEKNHMYGKKLSNKHRAALSRAGRGRKHSPETLRKMSEARRKFWEKKRVSI